jgi:Raf kinase inhibitor-like YbhB/YbcL family protein
MQLKRSSRRSIVRCPVRRVPAILLLAAALLITLAGCTSGSGPTSTSTATTTGGRAVIVVTSTAFRDGAAIPAQYTCDGQGVSPPLMWTGVPAGTASVALVVDDPDAPSGPFVHWILAGLPGSDGSITEGAGTGVGLPSGAVSANNSAGRSGYTPPCPPSGTHHYRFTLFALDGATNVTAGVPADQAMSAIMADAVAHGTLTGTYSRGS